jgi:hypothetical protein
MDYYSTNEVLEAVAGQIRDQVSNYADDVIVFDGSLEQAIRDHFGQTTKSALKTVVFLALSEDIPDSISGAGLPIRNGLATDIYVIVRSDGRARYTKDRQRLYDVSDALIYTVFDCANRTEDYTSRVAANNFVLRRRGNPTDDSIMAHLIRFIFKPRVP